MNKTNLMILWCSISIINNLNSFQLSKKSVSIISSVTSFALGYFQDRKVSEFLDIKEGDYPETIAYMKKTDGAFFIMSGISSMINFELVSNDTYSSQVLITYLLAVCFIVNGLRIDKTCNPTSEKEKAAAQKGAGPGTLYGVSAGLMISNIINYLVSKYE